jgi:ankyrin repeat protein
MAAQEGFFAIVQKLIASGAAVNAMRTDDGTTPLYMAAAFGHTATVAKLLQHDADKSIRGEDNETPLEAAQSMNYAAVVALLA